MGGSVLGRCRRNGEEAAAVLETAAVFIGALVERRGAFWPSGVDFGLYYNNFALILQQSCTPGLFPRPGRAAGGRVHWYGIMINNRRSPRNHHLPCFHNDVRIRRRSCMNREIVIDKKASRSRSTRWPRPATRARANSVVCLRRPCTRRRLTSSCITASRRVSRSFAAPISPSRRSRAASGSAARAIIPRCSGSLCSAPPTEYRRNNAAQPQA